VQAGRLDVAIPLVSQLITSQFPQWAELPLRPVELAGSDNAMYRLGEDMVVRLPGAEWAFGQAEKEQRWLSQLAPHLPLAIPVPLGKGAPTEDFPHPWNVYRWLDGETATAERLADLNQATGELAEFVTALQSIDPADGPNDSEGSEPLAMRDSETRVAIAAMEGLYDTAVLYKAWDAAVQAPLWDKPPVWVHGDLHPGNLLAVDGKLSAVIDWGGVCVGDPAIDLMIAWTLLTPETREIFRAALPTDDATWARGRGWGLTGGVLALAAYGKTHPTIAVAAGYQLDEVIADYQLNGQ
jgi:aminoglycoside phosphotransferase (APT) family kinase protein